MQAQPCRYELLDLPQEMLHLVVMRLIVADLPSAVRFVEECCKHCPALQAEVFYVRGAKAHRWRQRWDGNVSLRCTPDHNVWRWQLSREDPCRWKCAREPDGTIAKRMNVGQETDKSAWIAGNMMPLAEGCCGFRVTIEYCAGEQCRMVIGACTANGNGACGIAMHPLNVRDAVRRYACYRPNKFNGSLGLIPWRGPPPGTTALLERLRRDGGGQSLVGTSVEIQATRSTLTMRIDGAPSVVIAMEEAFYPYAPSFIRPWVHLHHWCDRVSLRGW